MNRYVLLSAPVLFSIAVLACSSDSTTTPTNAACVGHASGAGATQLGITKVVSNVTFGSLGISDVGAIGDDVYVATDQGLAPTFGGLGFTAPTGQYGILAKVAATAEWLWLAEHGAGPFNARVRAWNNGMVALVATTGPLKFTSETGAAGPTANGTGSVFGILLAAKAKGGAVDWLTLPTAKDDSNIRLAVTSEGAIFVTGTFADGADFGTGPLTCGDSPAIARYDAVGKKALWARCLGTKGSAIIVDGLTADGSGQPTVTGFPGPNPDFGLGPKAVNADAGASFVLSLDNSGKTKTVSYTLRAYASNVVATDDGTLFFSGDSPQDDAKNGLIDYFGSTYKPCGADGFKTIVSRMNPDGKIAWTKMFARSLDMVVFPDKKLALIARSLDGTPVADGLTIPAVGAPAIIYLDPNGDVTGVTTLGDGVTKNQVGLNLFPMRATSTGLWLGGMFDGTLKLKSTLTSTNASDVLIKLSPP